MRAVLFALVAGGGLALSSATGLAQEYPSKPIRIVVPFPPGGQVGVVSRTLGDKLIAAWGQPVIVDSRPGAGGIIAADAVAKSPNDGYTLLLSTANVAINPSLYKKIPYDTEKDLTPIVRMIAVPNVLVVRADLPATNLAELIDLAKKQPGKLNYSSAGSGTFPHLAFELFKMQAAVDIAHIPYKGAAPALLAVLAKDVDIVSTNYADVLPHIAAGKVRAIALTSSSRSRVLPNVPTIAEAGIPGFEAVGWMAVFAPGSTPKPIVDKLNRQIIDAIKSSDFNAMLVGQGFDLIADTPEEFAVFLHKDIARWAQAVKVSGATAD